MPISPTHVSELVQKLVAERGFDLEDVAVRTRDGQEELSIVVDRDGGSDLDVLAGLSTEISDLLDAELVAEMMVRVSASFLTVPSRVVDITDDAQLATVARQFLVPMLNPAQ